MYNFPMARCRVSFTDSAKTEHAVEAEAESLYEALPIFGTTRYSAKPPGLGTGFTAAGLGNPTQHKIRPQQVTKGGADDA